MIYVKCEQHEGAVCYREATADGGLGRWMCPACEIETLRRLIDSLERMLRARTDHLA